MEVKRQKESSRRFTSCGYKRSFFLQVRPLVENQSKVDLIFKRSYLGNHLEFRDSVYAKMFLRFCSTRNNFKKFKKVSKQLVKRSSNIKSLPYLQTAISREPLGIFGFCLHQNVPEGFHYRKRSKKTGNKNFANARSRTWVASATTKNTNHYITFAAHDGSSGRGIRFMDTRQ